MQRQRQQAQVLELQHQFLPQQEDYLDSEVWEEWVECLALVEWEAWAECQEWEEWEECQT
jgi:hypothetical protein